MTGVSGTIPCFDGLSNYFPGPDAVLLCSRNRRRTFGSGLVDEIERGSLVGRPSAILVNQLSFSYGKDQKVLDQVSFEIHLGETVGLVGPNGAGKTTLFLCLSGVCRGTKGMITIAGLDPSASSSRRKLPSKVGIVFQDSDDQIINASVRDEVAFGPLNLGIAKEETQQRVSEALTSVGLEGYEDKVPFHLSGGEKRRVALAGVLAMKPEILLLDEPTMFLDPRGRRELIGLLSTLPATKILATHDLEMVLEICEKVLLLDDGQLVASGKPRELLANASLMEAHGLEVPYSLR